MLMHPRRPKWTWWLCQQLGIARSVYFTWQQLQHDPGPRAQENADITAAVLYVFNRHRGFTAHHGSVKSSGPLASRLAATALPGSCAALN